MSSASCVNNSAVGSNSWRVAVRGMASIMVRKFLWISCQFAGPHAVILGWNATLDPRRNHLRYVAPAKGDALAHQLQGARLGLNLGRQALKLFGSRDKGGKVEAEGELYLPSLPFRA